MLNFSQMHTVDVSWVEVYIWNLTSTRVADVKSASK